MAYTINKIAVSTYDSTTGQKVVENSKTVKTWQDVKEFLKDSSWWYGGGFNVFSKDEFIGTSETFNYCGSDFMSITLAEFKESKEDLA